MMDFGAELRRLMVNRGLSLREAARRVPCDSGYLSKVASGRRRPSPELVARLDEILGATGRLRDIAPQAPSRGKGSPVCSGAVEALQVAMTDDAAAVDIGGDGLAELVAHYSQVVVVAPSPRVYGELRLGTSRPTMPARC